MGAAANSHKGVLRIRLGLLASCRVRGLLSWEKGGGGQNLPITPGVVYRAWLQGPYAIGLG